MTIDPIPHAAANRTENNNVAFAQLSPLDGGEGSALESAQSSFSSVLSSLVEVAADAPDPADLAPTGLLAQPADPGPEADPSLDPATLLAQFLGGANPTLVPAVAAMAVRLA